MLQFKNATPFTGAISLFPDPDGVDTLFAIVKGTFTLGERLTVAEEQVPVTMESVFRGDPASTSLVAPSDVSLAKTSTDVVILGDACAPRGRPARTMDVSVSIGPVNATVRVVGNRVWASDGVTYGTTAPEPFETMPLVWERAFGGRDESDRGPREEPRNPVGTGFRAGDGREPIEGTALPNIEDPRDPITSWKHRPTPVCFGPILPHWEPRRSYGGTYDEEWQKERAPYLPSDFDPRFLQVAPPPLIAPSPLNGGESVELIGFQPHGLMQFSLPAVRPRVVFQLKVRAEERPAMLDTVIIEPTARRLQLVWRAAFRCDKEALKVRHVEASVGVGEGRL